jgi:hypothetical protein
LEGESAVNKNVGVPIIVAAVIGLVILLVIMGRTFMAPPAAVKTAPPPWIDPATGKPRAEMSGSGQSNPMRGVSHPPATTPGR